MYAVKGIDADARAGHSKVNPITLGAHASRNLHRQTAPSGP